jgi:starch phosphorylase
VDASNHTPRSDKSTNFERAQDGNKNAPRSRYEKVNQVVLPLFYRNRSGFSEVMRHAIALNGCFFNPQRMLQQYVRGVLYRAPWRI